MSNNDLFGSVPQMGMEVLLWLSTIVSLVLFHFVLNAVFANKRRRSRQGTTQVD